MFNILFLRGFNNYFNRTVIRYTSLADYMAHATNYFTATHVNFNPNDGITTELIVGNENQQEAEAPYNWENDGSPEYCVCYTLIGTSVHIKSRWFIMETERTRAGQYRIALKRDVMAEYFNKIKTQPCFIEKGIINDKNNVLLYNKESMTFNQIKNREYLLKDSTNNGWIVGYVAKNAPNSQKTVQTTILMEGTPAEYYDYDDLPFDYTSNTYTSNDINEVQLVLPSVSIKERASRLGTTWAYVDKGYYIFSYKDNSFKFICTEVYITDASSSTGSTVSDLIPYYRSSYSWPSLFENTLTFDPGNSAVPRYPLIAAAGWMYDGDRPIPSSYNLSASTKTTHLNAYKNLDSVYQNPAIDDYNNKIVKGSDNKFYKLSISKQFSGYRIIWRNAGSVSSDEFTYSGAGSLKFTQAPPDAGNNAASNYMSDIASSVMSAYTQNTQDYYSYNSEGQVFLISPEYTYIISRQLLSTETLTAIIAAQNESTPTRAITYDGAFDIFAIPYGEIQFKAASDGATYTTSATRGLAMARAIASSFGENACYDLQLVPYCPSEIIRNWMEEETVLPLYNLDSTAYDTYNVTSGGVTSAIGFILWCSSCKGTFDINIEINPSSMVEASPALTYKISNECELYRLASPNFNGMFEFSLAKNNGVSKFNVDYTYKPYQPYIHINPDFKGLYGQDWNDARGLICGGDFSLSFNNSAWTTYQNNNKNWQQSLDRQIQNMDVNNAIALEKQQFNAIAGGITGTLGAGIGGAMAGAAAGPWGAVIGGAVGLAGGAAANIAGAVKDREWLERQQREAKSYFTDMYGYSLGNIQAMPYSLAKTESLTNNNKIWPILEIYQPKVEEEEALWNKIKYNGMTIMVVGNLEDYITTTDFDKAFIKGKMIKIENIGDDFHIMDAIYQEVDKGIYIPQ